MNGFPWLPALIISAGSATILLIGGMLTDTGPWYRGLTKPDWQPPDWLFAPARTLIYAMVTGGMVIAWINATELPQLLTLLTAFVLNGLLNIGWSLVFFRWRRPDQALLEVVALWVSTVLFVCVAYGIVPAAGLLIAPYIAWVAFAAILNRTVVGLNAFRFTASTVGHPAAPASF